MMVDDSVQADTEKFFDKKHAALSTQQSLAAEGGCAPHPKTLMFGISHLNLWVIPIK
jgi:hypothetical protein